jgi:hypothetical protein
MKASLPQSSLSSSGAYGDIVRYNATQLKLGTRERLGQSRNFLKFKIPNAAGYAYAIANKKCKNKELSNNIMHHPI